MIVVGLTGGIGSGKSTVSALLTARGVVVIDADAITRELQRHGEPVWQAIVERFGPGVVREDGELDRPALAAIVFADAEALADLNKLVHPAVAVEIARRVDAERGTDRIVVLDVPLLVQRPAKPREGEPGEGGEARPARTPYDVAGIVVVDVPVEVAVSRLVGQRGMVEADVRARMANQVSREDRLARADYVLDNSGDLTSLVSQIDALIDWMRRQPAVPPPAA